MFALYQFPISHYCEKSRWALDYKKIEYKTVNLFPGLHTITTKKLAARTSVPIIVHDDKVIQGSNKIITYLDKINPEQSLTPENEQLKNDALEWERYIDKEIGIHVRRCCYYILLDHPDFVIKLLTYQGPWYGKPFITVLFPRLRAKMKRLMDINKDTAESSKTHLTIAIDKLHHHLQEHPFLVGEKFSRADLAAASLLAPLRMPEKYGLVWPKNVPAQFQELSEVFSKKTDWVDNLYKNYR